RALGPEGGALVIGTLLWKEYREHRAVWGAMAGFGAVLVGGLAKLVDPGDLPLPWTTEFVVVLVAALSMAGTYGLVCGSMMLAGEREAGTLAFLDTQPIHRLRLWGLKFLVAVLLTLCQVLFLTTLLYLLGLAGQQLPTFGWFALLLGVALEGLAWGLFSSAL